MLGTPRRSGRPDGVGDRSASVSVPRTAPCAHFGSYQKAPFTEEVVEAPAECAVLSK